VNEWALRFQEEYSQRDATGDCRCGSLSGTRKQLVFVRRLEGKVEVCMLKLHCDR